MQLHCLELDSGSGKKIYRNHYHLAPKFKYLNAYSLLKSTYSFSPSAV